MDAYRFDAALRRIRDFVWHDLADDYVELVKGRLYGGRPGERAAARHALYTALSATLRMLSPFAPFVTEEIYASLPGTEGSVHAAAWPQLDVQDPEAEAAGRLVADVASAIRAWKSDRGLALNAELDRVEVYVDGGAHHLDTYDLSETINAPVHVRDGTPGVELAPVGVGVDHSILGPEFREKAGAVVAALEAADPAELQAQTVSTGGVTLEVDGEEVEIDGEAFEVVEEYRAEGGEEVAVVETDDATVILYP